MITDKDGDNDDKNGNDVLVGPELDPHRHSEFLRLGCLSQASNTAPVCTSQVDYIVSSMYSLSQRSLAFGFAVFSIQPSV